MTIAEAAKSLSLDADTYRRIERGDSMHSNTLRSILLWMMSEE